MYSDFREEMLFALYEEERSGNLSDFVSFKTLAADYDIDWKPGWLIELQRELREEGLIRGPSNGQNDDMAIGRLSGSGMRRVEEEHGTLDGEVPTLIVKPSEPLVVHPLEIDDAVSASRADEPTLTFYDASATNSASWTGIEQRLSSSPEVVEQIRLKIREIDRLVDETGLTNAERQKAKAISEALIKLVESPEPEWKAIMELLTSKPLTAILNLTAILQIAARLIIGS